jgi:hypothetical protein
MGIDSLFTGIVVTFQDNFCKPGSHSSQLFSFHSVSSVSARIGGGGNRNKNNKKHSFQNLEKYKFIYYLFIPIENISIIQIITMQGTCLMSTVT